MEGSVKKVFKVEVEIDRNTIELAIASVLYCGYLKPTNANIAFAIKDKISSEGFLIINFPENWGKHILDYRDENKEEIDNIYNKFIKSYK
jgi:hypothetical protein